MNKKATAIPLLSIFCIALVIRLYFALRCGDLPYYSDMALYHDAAVRHGFPTSLPPGYPLFLRAIYAIFGADSDKAVFVVQGLISSLTVLLMYWVTSRVADRKAGLFAAGTAAIYPNLIFYNLTTLTDTIGIFFVMLLLAVLVAAMSDKKRSVLAAFVLSLAFTFRPVILLLVPGVFLSIKRRWIFALAAFVLLAPMISFEMMVGKSFQRSAVAVYETYHPSLDGSQFVNPDSTELGSDELSSAVYFRAAMTNIMNNKAKALDNIYNKVTVVFSRGWDTFVLQPIVGYGTNRYWIMAYAYVPIMLLGFVGMARRYDKSNRMLALPALSYLIIAVLFFLFKFRYRLIIEPVLIMYAAMLVCNGRRPALRFAGDARASEAVPSFRVGKDWDIISVILFLALALRVYLAFSYQAPPDSRELEEYNRLALQGGLDSGTAPLYPLFLRAIYSVFGDYSYRSVFLAQGIMNSLAVFLLYLTVARLCSRRAGIIAAAIGALYPNFILYGLSIRTEALGVLVVVLLMAAATAQLAERTRASFSAVLVGLMILVRPIYVCLAPGAILVARKRRLLLLVLMLTLVPYTLLNAFRSQRIEPVYKASAFELVLDNFSGRDNWRQAIDNIYNNAAAVLTKGRLADDAGQMDVVRRTSVYAALYCYEAIMLLGFIGLARYYRKEHRAAVFPILLYVVLLMLFSNFKVELRVLLEPVLIAYAAMLFGGAGKAPQTHAEEIACS